MEIKIMDLRKYNFGLPLQITDESHKEKHPVKERVFMTTRELALRWRKDRRTIEQQRIKNKGAPFYRINGSVLYDLNDVIEYELQNYFRNGFKQA